MKIESIIHLKIHKYRVNTTILPTTSTGTVYKPSVVLLLAVEVEAAAEAAVLADFLGDDSAAICARDFFTTCLGSSGNNWRNMAASNGLSGFLLGEARKVLRGVEGDAVAEPVLIRD